MYSMVIWLFLNKGQTRFTVYTIVKSIGHDSGMLTSGDQMKHSYLELTLL